jgi:hypothetical protein
MERTGNSSLGLEISEPVGGSRRQEQRNRLAEMERTGNSSPGPEISQLGGLRRREEQRNRLARRGGEDGEFVPGSRNLGARRGINKTSSGAFWDGAVSCHAVE